MGRACAVYCTTGAALIFLGFCLVPEMTFAASSGPGINEEQGAAPQPSIRACPVGDEGIYTKVPNPEAGHDKEVIPPPGSPGGDPNVEPR